MGDIVSRKGWRRIGIEPMMFLYMFGFMITSVIEESFFMYKACRVDYGFSEDICRNISKEIYQDYKTQVQIKTAEFHQWNNIAYHIVPILLSFFLGAWSDQVGRKLPILIGIAGNVYYSSMIVVIALMTTWPLDTVIWLASFPCALTGSSLTVFMAAFSYLADTTTLEERTMRTTIVEIVYLLPMPLGVALGSYLFYNWVNQSYALMFVISASLHASAMVASWIFLDWKTNRSVHRQASGACKDVLSISHVRDSLTALVKPRRGNRRLYLLLSLLAMTLYTFQRDEKPMLFMYAQHEFNWDVSTFSTFRTFQSAFFVAGLLIGGPILVRLLKLRDTVIVMIGALSHSIARVLFMCGTSSKWLYSGAIVASLGPVVASVLRSFVSKLIPSSDRGKVFAMFTVTDTAVPMISAPIYTQVYNAAVTSCPELVFLVTLITQMGVFIIGLTLTLKTRGQSIESGKEENEENQQKSEEDSVMQ